VGKVRVLGQLGDYQKAIYTMEFLREEALSAYSAFASPRLQSFDAEPLLCRSVAADPTGFPVF